MSNNTKTQNRIKVGSINFIKLSAKISTKYKPPEDASKQKFIGISIPLYRWQYAAQDKALGFK
jgi:hypothetical protein